MRIYLTVPYSEKDYVKNKGALWDPTRKSWYVENLENLHPFLKYMDLKYRLPCK